MARNDWKRISPKWEIGEEVRARFSTGGFRKATIVSFPSDTWQGDDAGAAIEVMDSKGNIEHTHWRSIYVEKAGEEIDWASMSAVRGKAHHESRDGERIWPPTSR